MDFMIAGMAAMGACCFSNPFEVVRTRMQLQGELKTRRQTKVYYKNIIHAAYVIAKVDGPLALQKGLSLNLCAQLLLNGTRLGLYHYFDRMGLMRDENGVMKFHKSVVAASLSGGLSCALCNPLFLVKTHLQSQAAESIAVGYQHSHTGPFQALKKIFIRNGIKGLCRGNKVNISRGLLGSPTQLTTFLYTKEWLMRKGFLPDTPVIIVLMSSMLGGVCVSLSTNPFDLVNTRLYNQKYDKDGKGVLYNGVLDCVMKIWYKEGFTGFYKGLVTNYARNSLHTVLCFVFWEELKMYFGRDIKITKNK